MSFGRDIFIGVGGENESVSVAVAPPAVDEDGGGALVPYVTVPEDGGFV
jgi:hypothetical protein